MLFAELSGLALLTDQSVRFHRRTAIPANEASREARRMSTQGEMEAAVCDAMRRFEQEYMGRGPKDIRAYLIGDLLVVRLHGVLTAAEQHRVKSLTGEKGRDLLKQVRVYLIEAARPLMEAMLHDVTGVAVVSLRHDISTVTSDEIVVFTLAESPLCREAKRK